MPADPHESASQTSANGDPPPADAERMLLDFMRSRDVECPVCGYNLRNLTGTTCPECEHELVLRVGVQRVQVLWLAVSIVPGGFSGLCAFFITIMMVINYSMNGSLVGFPWIIIALVGFGWLSGFTSLGIIIARNRFLALPQSTQRGAAIALWTIHFMAFLMLIIMAFG